MLLKMAVLPLSQNWIIFLQFEMYICLYKSIYVYTHICIYIYICVSTYMYLKLKEHCIHLYVSQIPLLNGFSRVWAVVNNAAAHMGAHMLFQCPVCISSGYIPWIGIAASYGNSVFNFLSNLHNVFHSGCTNLHPCQQCTKVPFFLYPYQYLFCFFIFIIPIVMGVRWKFIVVLICIFLMVSDVEHLFVYLLAI